MKHIDFYLITPFKDLVSCYFNESIIQKGVTAEKISVNFINPRDFTTDKHHTIDDKPYGGTPGMVYMFEPFYKAVMHAKQLISKTDVSKTFTVLFKPDAKMLNDSFVKDFNAQFSDESISFILILPRYEGIDARILELVDFSVSVGPYVLTGAELVGAIFVDVFARFVDGVLGNPKSNVDDTSFVINNNELYVQKEADVYTRPRVVNVEGKDLEVPEIYLSGHHAQINEFRKSSKKKTKVQFLSINDITK